MLNFRDFSLLHRKFLRISYVIKKSSGRDAYVRDSTHKYYLLTVEFGIKTYRAYLEWCEEAKAILREEREESE